jgi:hypothetical protein
MDNLMQKSGKISLYTEGVKFIRSKNMFLILMETNVVIYFDLDAVSA